MSADPDPDLQILRDAEARRGGCGAFLVGVAAMALVGTVHGTLLITLHERLNPLQMFAAVVAGIVASVAVAIPAAKLFTKARLKMTGKDRPPPSA